MQQQLTPDQLIELAKKNRWFTINKEDVSHNLVSYSIAPKRQKDDIAYQDPVVKYNFRRGLTLIQELNEFKRINLKIARKGLRKFDYLYPEFVIQDSKIGKHVSKLKNEFLQSVDRFKGSFLVSVIEKANGQNCQISFTNNHWVICSKNRVLFIKKGEQIPWKDKQLHGFRLEIAELWFKKLKQMKQELVSELQILLETKTLIGEYCNSSTHQHIVKYNQPNIFFYAVVQNESEDNCLPVNQAYKIFQHFSLKSAKLYIQKQAENSSELYQLLYSIYKNVTKASIEQIGEGGVIYIQGIKKEGNSSILCLYKIKSIQYLILRRLREKLVQYLKKYRKSTKTLLKKYIQEIKELASVYKPFAQIQEYIKLGEKSFQLVENGSNLVLKFVINKFINFLAFVRQNHEKPIQDFDKLIKLSGKQLENIPIQNQDQDSQEEQKQQQSQKINEQETKNKKDQKRNETIKEQLQLSKKKIIILVPITIPSSGKTVTFKPFLNIKDTEVEIVSSDVCRQEVMNELKLKNKKLTHQQLFDKSAKGAKSLFSKYLANAFHKLSSSKTENCLLIIDKNHPPSAIQSTMKDLDSIIGKHKKDVKIVALIPECENPLQQKGKYSFPFSIEYLVSCSKRVVDREVHETLIGQSNHKVNVILGFFGLFRGFRFNKYNLNKYFDQSLSIRMHNPKITVPKELQLLLTKIVVSKKPGDFDQSPDIGKVVYLIKEVKIEEIPLQQLQIQNGGKIKSLFERFYDLKIDEKEEKQESGEIQK